MGMEYITIPDFPVLRGEKAIKALSSFIDELKEQRVEELTDKQTTVLIKFATGLISSIETEKRWVTPDKCTRKIFRFYRKITRVFQVKR